MQCFLYSLHPREIRRQSSTRCGSVKLLFLVPAPRGKPERQMKEMEHRSGTFFSGIWGKPERQMKEMEHRSGTFFSGISAYKYASRISIADRGAAMNRGSWSSRSSSTAAAAQQHSSSSTAAQQQQHSSTAAAAHQQQHSSSGGGDVELPFLVPAPRVKPERQMKKMEHRSGTFLRDSCILCIADQHCEQQKQQHSSSSTVAVVAATSRLRTKRTSVDTPVSLLFSFLRFRAI